MIDRVGARRGGRWACVARSGLACVALAFSGCIHWLHDERPWFVNATGKTLEIESTHVDGHTLRIRLPPGSRVPLGAAEQEILKVAVRRPEEPEVLVPESTIRACLDDRQRSCLGWEIGEAGLQRLERSKAGS